MGVEGPGRLQKVVIGLCLCAAALLYGVYSEREAISVTTGSYFEKLKTATRAESRLRPLLDFVAKLGSSVKGKSLQREAAQPIPEKSAEQKRGKLLSKDPIPEKTADPNSITHAVGIGANGHATNVGGSSVAPSADKSGRASMHLDHSGHVVRSEGDFMRAMFKINVDNFVAADPFMDRGDAHAAKQAGVAEPLSLLKQALARNDFVDAAAVYNKYAEKFDEIQGKINAVHAKAEGGISPALGDQEHPSVFLTQQQCESENKKKFFHFYGGWAHLYTNKIKEGVDIFLSVVGDKHHKYLGPQGADGHKTPTAAQTFTSKAFLSCHSNTAPNENPLTVLIPAWLSISTGYLALDKPLRAMEAYMRSKHLFIEAEYKKYLKSDGDLDADVIGKTSARGYGYPYSDFDKTYSALFLNLYPIAQSVFREAAHDLHSITSLMRRKDYSEEDSREVETNALKKLNDVVGFCPATDLSVLIQLGWYMFKVRRDTDMAKHYFSIARKIKGTNLNLGNAKDGVWNSFEPYAWSVLSVSEGQLALEAEDLQKARVRLDEATESLNPYLKQNFKLNPESEQRMIDETETENFSFNDVLSVVKNNLVEKTTYVPPSDKVLEGLFKAMGNLAQAIANKYLVQDVHDEHHVLKYGVLGNVLDGTNIDTWELLYRFYDWNQVRFNKELHIFGEKAVKRGVWPHSRYRPNTRASCNVGNPPQVGQVAPDSEWMPVILTEAFTRRALTPAVKKRLSPYEAAVQVIEGARAGMAADYTKNHKKILVPQEWQALFEDLHGVGDHFAGFNASKDLLTHQHPHDEGHAATWDMGWLKGQSDGCKFDDFRAACDAAASIQNRLNVSVFELRANTFSQFAKIRSHSNDCNDRIICSITVQGGGAFEWDLADGTRHRQMQVAKPGNTICYDPTWQVTRYAAPHESTSTSTAEGKPDTKGDEPRLQKHPHAGAAGDVAAVHDGWVTIDFVLKHPRFIEQNLDPSLSEQDKTDLGFDYFESVATVESPVRFRDIRLITHHSIHDRNDRDATVINTNFDKTQVGADGHADKAKGEHDEAELPPAHITDSPSDVLKNLSTVDKILISIEDYVKETDFPDVVHLES